MVADGALVSVVPRSPPAGSGVEGRRGCLGACGNMGMLGLGVQGAMQNWKHRNSAFCTQFSAGWPFF